MFVVPVYDGRSSFSLAKYWAKPYHDDVAPGTTVTILFSIKRGNIPEDAKGYTISGTLAGVYLNVLAVVVIAENSDPFIPDTSPDPVAVHGVDRLPRLEEFGNTSLEDEDNLAGAEGAEVF